MTFPIQVQLADKALSARTDLDAWFLSIKQTVGMRILGNLTKSTDHLDRYIACAELTEPPGTYVCCSFYQRDINDALTRAGLYMGAAKGLPAKTLVTQDNWTLKNYKKLVAGHNLPGSIVTEFFRVAAKDLNPAERAFYDQFLNSEEVVARGRAFYLIGLSIQSTKEQKSILSHEIYHAYYFLNAAYRDAVNRFWRDRVSAEDRAAMTTEIGRAYSTDDEDLVIDECQAYLIQSGADKDRLRRFTAKYREVLLSALDQAGARPALTF